MQWRYQISICPLENTCFSLDMLSWVLVYQRLSSFGSEWLRKIASLAFRGGTCMSVVKIFGHFVESRIVVINRSLYALCRRDLKLITRFSPRTSFFTGSDIFIYLTDSHVWRLYLLALKKFNHNLKKTVIIIATTTFFMVRRKTCVNCSRYCIKLLID